MRCIPLRLVAASLIVLAGASTIQAGCQGTAFNFCSKTFYASAPCDGTDRRASVKHNDCPRGPKACGYCESGQSCPLIEGWEPTEITVVGVEITIFEGNEGLLYAYAGNGYNPNQMAAVGRGQSHTRQFYPPGMGFKLPPSGTNGFTELHVACLPKNASQVQIYYTVYYTVAP